MSNTSVGQVYQQIIRDVVETSRVDFEEGGVDEAVLEELSRGWQAKLSALGVAQFPWDPKAEPMPTSTPVSSTPGPSNSISYQQNADTPPMQQPQSTLTMPTLPPMPAQSSNNGPRIKAEPGADGGINQTPHVYNAPAASANAQQRAMQNLQTKYGAGATASINAMQGIPQQQAPQQGQGQQPNVQPGARPNASPNMQQRPPQGQQLTQQQIMYQQAMARHAQQQAQAQAQVQNHIQPTQNPGGVSSAQTDGAGDDLVEANGILKRVDKDGNEFDIGRVEIDAIIRRKIEAVGQQIEGGGLMLPLREHKTIASRKKTSTTSPSHRRSRAGFPGPSQVDGVDDDSDEKDDDEDAINSDLDDEEDGLDENEDDDEALSHIMLCMYDKVQRVKNKWKCVMKDGVLTVNGREYVFHKATGEYEW